MRHLLAALLALGIAAPAAAGGLFDAPRGAAGWSLNGDEAIYADASGRTLLRLTCDAPFDRIVVERPGAAAGVILPHMTLTAGRGVAGIPAEETGEGLTGTLPLPDPFQGRILYARALRVEAPEAPDLRLPLTPEMRLFVSLCG